MSQLPRPWRVPRPSGLPYVVGAPPFPPIGPPFPPSGPPFPPSGPPFPPSGFPLPPTGSDGLLPFPPPCSSRWEAPFPRGADGGHFRPKHYPRSRGRVWAHGYHARGGEQQKRHRDNYEGDSAGKRTRTWEAERSSQSQHQAIYCKYMFDDPWKDLLSPDEEQEHLLHLIQRFGHQSATEGNELPENKGHVDGDNEAALATSQDCPPQNEQSLTSPVTATLASSNVGDSSKSRTRPKISLPPPHFTSSGDEPP